ncbi:MAG: HAD-superfamily hydrolase [Firmicutes bacterium]|nr:HAD-superfamily hydrolase [Bacillota bacterium]
MSPVLHQVRFGDRLARVAAVAFDKDGTLLESQPFWHGLWRLRRSLIYDRAGEETAAVWEQEMGAVGGAFHRAGPFAVATLAEETTLLAGLFYRRMGWSWEQARSASLQIHRESNERLDLERVTAARKGAVAAVRSLHEAGVPVGIVTSDEKPRAVRALELIGLPATTWAFFLTPADVVRPKPAPDMVTAACAAVGCTPESLAVVGDSLVDLQMARAAGALAVAVPEYADDADLLSAHADILLSGPHEISLKV